MRVICHLATRVGGGFATSSAAPELGLTSENSEMTEMTVSFSLFED